MGESVILVKFQEEYEHILELQQSGLLYMNIPSYFREIEDKGPRWDSGEGRELSGRDGKATTADGRELKCEWGIFAPNEAKVNIFCMYAIRPTARTFPVGEHIYKFWKYTLVLLDTQQFIERTASSMKSQGIKFRANLVEYVDDDYEGECGPFTKRRRFAYQSEWRLACYDGPGGPREVRIGSLEDISIMMPSEEVNRRIKLGQETFEITD